MARLTWHGHACFEYETLDGKFLIDPFLSGNPKADVAPGDIQGIQAIVVSHGHAAHMRASAVRTETAASLGAAAGDPAARRAA